MDSGRFLIRRKCEMAVDTVRISDYVVPLPCVPHDTQGDHCRTVCDADLVGTLSCQETNKKVGNRFPNT